jgi:hypothetical protein
MFLLQIKRMVFDAKAYFDVKNWIYALKKEIDIQAVKFYYILFV